MSVRVQMSARSAIVAAVVQAILAVTPAAAGGERAAVAPAIEASQSPPPDSEPPVRIAAPGPQTPAPASDFVRNPFDSGMGIRFHRYGRSTRVFGTH